jgi:hypothetical protein
MGTAGPDACFHAADWTWRNPRRRGAGSLVVVALPIPLMIAVVALGPMLLIARS